MQESAKFILNYRGKEYNYHVVDNGFVFFAYVIDEATHASPCYFPDAILMIRKGKWEIDNFEEDFEILKALAKEIYTWQLSTGNKLDVDEENPRFIQRFINNSSEIQV